MISRKFQDKRRNSFLRNNKRILLIITKDYLYCSSDDYAEKCNQYKDFTIFVVTIDIKDKNYSKKIECYKKCKDIDEDKGDVIIWI